MQNTMARDGIENLGLEPRISNALLRAGVRQISRLAAMSDDELLAINQFEKIEQEGDQYQATEALFDVRDTINRVTRRFAEALTDDHRKNGGEKSG